MKKINFILYIFFLLLYSYLSNAQTIECPMVPNQADIDYMDATRAERAAVDIDYFRNNVISIPLTAHIIRMSDGTGGLSMSDLNTSIAQLNVAFQPVNFEFELCAVKYIDNDGYFDGITQAFDSESEEYEMAQSSLVFGTVNVFYIPNAIIGGWSSFSWQLSSKDKDWNVIKNSSATNGSTLAHELGHYFDLIHTHEGCDGGCEELVDRDNGNCGQPGIGDLLCDTPADPRLFYKFPDNSYSYLVDSDCNYIENPTDASGNTYVLTDANGIPYTPDTRNMMSYTRIACRASFSPEQIVRMQQSFAVGRSYLFSDCTGCENTLDVTYNFNNEHNQHFEVNDWITSTTTVNTGTDITYDAGNYICLNTGFLADNGSVFLGKIDGCDDALPLINEQSDTENSTVYATEDNEKRSETDELVTFKNRPNPFTGITTIEFTLKEDSSVTLSISDVTGRQLTVLIDSEQQSAGTHQVTFDGNAYSAGMYYYTIQADEYIGTQKMSLIK